MVDLTFLRNGLIALQGEAVQFRVNGILSDGRAVFQEPFSMGQVGSVDVRRSDPRMLMRGEDWDAAQLHTGAFVVVRGVEYVVAGKPERDESDLVEFNLRRSR